MVVCTHTRSSPLGDWRYLKLRAAIIGAGNVASRHHLPAYRRIKNAQIVAVCDTDRTRAQRLARKFRIPRVYTDHDELFRREQLDFVDVCTPVFTHMQICSRALTEGVNVLVEKPLCLTSTEALALSRLCDSKGVSVCVAHNYRYLAPVMKTRELIEDDKIGGIMSIVGIMRSTPLLHLPEWTWDEAKSGGIFFEAALHLVDLQTLFCGEHRRVIGFTCTRDTEYHFVQAFEALIEFKSGAVGTLDINFLSTTASAELDICGPAGNVRLLFFPPGMWRSQGFLTPITRTVGEGERVLNYVLATLRGNYNSNYHVGLIRKFVESIENRTDPPVNIAAALPTIRLLEELKEHASATVEAQV